MALSKEQKDVLVGVAAALTISLVALNYAPQLWPRMTISYVQPLLMLTVSLPLAFAIARMAHHRFFHAADINAAGSGENSAKARQLQAMLQNTLEQSLLAIAVIIGFGIAHPWSQSAWMQIGADQAMACVLFLIGRVLFFAFYARGAGARALGFALTFYPLVILLVCAVYGDIRYWAYFGFYGPPPAY